MDINEKMNNAIINDDIDSIEKTVSKGYAPVRVMLLNGCTETRWVDTTELHKTYYDDLSSDEKDFVIDTYKDKFNGKKWLDNLMAYHDKKVETWELKNGTHISQWLKSFNK